MTATITKAELDISTPGTLTLSRQRLEPARQRAANEADEQTAGSNELSGTSAAQFGQSRTCSLPGHKMDPVLASQDSVTSFEGG
jgi:hypothetical protein